MNFQKSFWYCLSLILFSISTPSSSGQTNQKYGDWQSLKLQYDKPTADKDFGLALPIGNGRLGAKIYGNVANAMLNLNETTLWSGIPRSYIGTIPVIMLRGKLIDTKTELRISYLLLNKLK